MQTFYISEILLLPKIIREKTESDEQSLAIQEIVNKYLKSKENFQKIIFFNKDLESFKIEMSRELLTETQHSSGFSANEKRAIVLLHFETATDPAQNAVLKIIEEAPANTLILIPAFNLKLILETIQSRCLIEKKYLNEKNESREELADLPRSFSEAIELAEQNKDKTQARKLIENFLQNKDINYKSKKALLKAHQNLKNNGNVQLNLENAFFEILRKK